MLVSRSKPALQRKRNPAALWVKKTCQPRMNRMNTDRMTRGARPPRALVCAPSRKPFEAGAGQNADERESPQFHKTTRSEVPGEGAWNDPEAGVLPFICGCAAYIRNNPWLLKPFA